MTKDKSHTVRLPVKVDDTLRKFFKEKVGISIEQFWQSNAFNVYGLISDNGEIPEDRLNSLDSFYTLISFSCGDDARKRLLSFRRITGNGHLKKSERGSIQVVISILDGGVVEVFDLTEDWDKQYSISVDKAFKLLINTEPTIVPMMKRVMQSQSTSSVIFAIRRLLEEECKYLDHEAQAEGYAQNTYGIVPKRTNKNELPREEL